MDFLQAVERLGGWAVVVWLVVWLTKRWEVRMHEIVNKLDVGQLATMRVLERQNMVLETQNNVLETQNSQLAEIRGLQVEIRDALVKGGAQR